MFFKVAVIYHKQLLLGSEVSGRLCFQSRVSLSLSGSHVSVDHD